MSYIFITSILLFSAKALAENVDGKNSKVDKVIAIQKVTPEVLSKSSPKEPIKKNLEKPEDKTPEVTIDYKNSLSQVEKVEKTAAELDKKALSQQAEAHQQLKISAEKNQQARQKRLELERQNIQALESELMKKKELFSSDLKEYLKSKCRLSDYKKGEFIHLTPELACLERNQLGVEFGPQYYHISQTGDLGGLSSGSASASLLQASSHHGLFQDIGVETFAGLRSLALTTEGTTSVTELFYNVGVNAYYKKYYFGFHLMQTPIMRYKTASTAEWSKIATSHALIGYRHVTRPLFFLGEYNYSHFKMFLGIPLSQSPAAGITTSDVKGFSFLVEGVTTRGFLKDNMRLGFKYFLKYQTLDFKGSWNGNSGDVSQSHSILGLNVFYQYDF